VKAVSAEDTNKHLAKVQGVIGKAKEILWRHGYPDNLRTVIVAGTRSNGYSAELRLTFDQEATRKRFSVTGFRTPVAASRILEEATK
jgi:hypothetical protein